MKLLNLRIDLDGSLGICHKSSHSCGAGRSIL